MKKIISTLLLLITANLIFAQIDVTIKANKQPLYSADGDTLSVCRDTVLIFEAKALIGGSPVSNASYEWDFDDGITQSGVDLDSVSHAYTVGGGYRVKVKVTDNLSNTGYHILPVKIAHLPRFTDSNNGLPQNQRGICKGSSSMLTAFAYPYKWTDTPIYFIENSAPANINNLQTYDVAFDFDEFKKDDKLASGDIDSICVTLSHKASKELKIKLICPTGQSIILKDDNATNDFIMGKPANNDDEESVGYRYCWSSSSTNGIMNDFTGDILPEKSYLPEESFTNLSGCPLNGDWHIYISDNNQNDKDGFIFSQEINFSENCLPAKWEFQDTLVTSSALWLGNGNPITQIESLSNGGIKGTASASPNVYGNNGYSFYLTNTWGCPADTVVVLPVEPATFTANPADGQAKLDVSLQSTTSWASSHFWKPGVDNEELSGGNASYTYLDEGEYKMVYIAKDDAGCSDSDTLLIAVSVEPSEVKIPNFFSPDGNGINDILTLTLAGMADFNFVIYSRWGRKVFETSDEEEAKNGWDGKLPNGLKASTGVYYFIFEGKGKDKKDWDEKGSIQLMR